MTRCFYSGYIADGIGRQVTKQKPTGFWKPIRSEICENAVGFRRYKTERKDQLGSQNLIRVALESQSFVYDESTRSPKNSSLQI